MQAEQIQADDSEGVYFSFGGRKNNIRISLSNFNDAKIIDIRKWYFNSSLQKYCPTQKGISIGQENFESLLKILDTHRNYFVQWLGNSGVDKVKSERNKITASEASVLLGFDLIKKPLPTGTAFHLIYEGADTTVIINQNHPVVNLFRDDSDSRVGKVLLEAVFFSLICIHDREKLDGEEFKEQFILNFSSRIRQNSGQRG